MDPRLVVVIGVISVSFAAIFVKAATAPSLIIGSYRTLFAFAATLPLALRDNRISIGISSRKGILLALLGGLFLAAHFAVWFTSLKMTSVASSTVLVTTQPVFVAAGSYFLFKERLSRVSLAGLITALVGSIIIGGADFHIQEAAAGDLLALLGAAFAGAYFMVGSQAQRILSTELYTLLAYGTCGAALLLLSIIGGIPLYPYPATDWLLFVSLALICTLGGHSLLNWSLKHLSASAVTTAVLGEPVGATIWAAVFLGEIPQPLQITGGIIVILGIYIFLKSSTPQSLLEV